MASKPTNPKNPAKTGNPAGGANAAARAAKPKLVAGGAALSVVGAEDAEGAVNGKAASGLRLKELVDRVVAATGGKKKDVKQVVEATLVAMGAALQKGESLNLPAFGKLRVARQGAEGGGAMTLKLRQVTGGGKGGAGAKTDKDPIADADDQD